MFQTTGLKKKTYRLATVRDVPGPRFKVCLFCKEQFKCSRYTHGCDQDLCSYCVQDGIETCGECKLSGNNETVGCCDFCGVGYCVGCDKLNGGNCRKCQV